MSIVETIFIVLFYMALCASVVLTIAFIAEQVLLGHLKKPYRIEIHAFDRVYHYPNTHVQPFTAILRLDVDGDVPAQLCTLYTIDHIRRLAVYTPNMFLNAIATCGMRNEVAVREMRSQMNQIPECFELMEKTGELLNTFVASQAEKSVIAKKPFAMRS